MKTIITSLMEIPVFYRLVQKILGGEGHREIKRYLKSQISKADKKILDQGCGTGEYGEIFQDKDYTGIDNNEADIKFAQQKFSGKFVVGSAIKMPFENNSFDVVFAVGLHHHLTDAQSKKAILEAIRVTKNDGQILVIDAMWPKNKFNLYGWFWRKMDRGQYVRNYKKTLELLPDSLRYDYQILSGGSLNYIAIKAMKKSMRFS